MINQGLTVNAVSFFHGRGPVFYTSLTSGSSAVALLKHLLASILWDHLVAMEAPLWKRCRTSDMAASPIQVVRGQLGRPHLLLGEHRGPAISFSEGGGKVWAALSGDESEIGLDVAGPDEFQRDYPFHRVFHSQELQDALRLVNGDLEKASALLWSIKEAVVKALGCAFHLVDPGEVTVCPPEEGAAGENGWHTFTVDLSGKAMVRFPMAARGSLWVRSLPRGKMWLSIALLNRDRQANE